MKEENNILLKEAENDINFITKNNNKAMIKCVNANVIDLKTFYIKKWSAFLDISTTSTQKKLCNKVLKIINKSDL